MKFRRALVLFVFSVLFLPAASSAGAPVGRAGQAPAAGSAVAFDGTSDRSRSLIPLSTAVFITALKELPISSEMEELVADLGKSMSETYRFDESKLRQISRVGKAERSVLIDELIGEMRSGADPTDRWLFDFGKAWGDALGQSYAIIAGDSENGRKKFAKDLAAMNWLLESPPADVPDEILARIRKTAAYNPENDAISDEFVRTFLRSTLEFAQYVVGLSRAKES